MRNGKIGLALIAILIGAAGFVYWRQTAPVAVEVASPKRNVEIRLFGLGTIEAQISTKVGFQVAGRIVSIEADQGDVVEPGAVLARLDGGVQRARVQKAEVAAQQAETTLSKAQALLSRAQINYQQRQTIADRRLTLVDRGAVSREAADEAVAAAAIAKADVSVAEAEVLVATSARKDFAATADIERAVLDQHLLVAPFRSRIIARLKELGSTVNPTEPVFSLIDPDTIWVRAFIDESLAGALALKQTAFVRLRSDPHTVVEAEIVRIDMENDRVTEERRIYVRCRACSPGHLVRHLGEQAEVEVVTRKVEEGLFVPLHAIDRYDGKSGSIWTVEDRRLARREVSLGDRTLGGEALVVGGLTPTAQVVVTRNRSGLREGHPARIAPGAAP